MNTCYLDYNFIYCCEKVRFVADRLSVVSHDSNLSSSLFSAFPAPSKAGYRVIEFWKRPLTSPSPTPTHPAMLTAHIPQCRDFMVLEHLQRWWPHHSLHSCATASPLLLEEIFPPILTESPLAMNPSWNITVFAYCIQSPTMQSKTAFTIHILVSSKVTHFGEKKMLVLSLCAT